MPSKTIATLRRRRRRISCALATLLSSGISSRAGGDPLRLRADAVAEAQSPTGLVVLQGEDKARPWLDVEGLVWAGAKPTLTGDVLVLALRVKEPHGYGEMRAGRFVLATGAILPVQIDGADAILRAPWGSTVEAFGGMPVVPRFGPRAYDWLAGGRVAQSIASRATLGLSYVQRREDGEVADEEIGADVAAMPVRWLDIAARGAYDLTSPGLADALVSVATHVEDWRFEWFAADRSPSRLLPATSLFSVLGDFPSQSVGGTVKWQAAPRLDLLASGAGQDVGGELGGNGWVRATLRLDNGGAGNLGLELRREDVASARWSGVRSVCVLPLGHGLRYSSEIEVVVPDHPDGRGAAWPWGLMALSWRSKTGWEVAGALEASSTPQHRYETDALVRLARSLDGAPTPSRRTPNAEAR
jgi:hypothetical protein